MYQAELLPRIADTSLSDEERIAMVATFVAWNGTPFPPDLLDRAMLPRGYEYRIPCLRDLIVVIAITEEEARTNPKSAMPDSAQLMRVGMRERNGRAELVAKKQLAVCTLSGGVNVVRRVDNAQAVREILAEWTAEPPTADQLGDPVPPASQRH